MKLPMSSRYNYMMLVALLALVAVLLMPAGRTYAEPLSEGIEIKSEVGYQGYVKQDKWFPVKLTLTNRMDKDVSGELVLSALSSNYGSTNDYVVPVELPQNTEVVVTLGVPGDVLKKSSSKLSFYKGSYNEGTKLPIIGNDYIDNKMTNSYTIGVLSRDPDTLNFMPSLNQKGYDIVIIPVTEDQLPEQSLLLDTLDTLVINDVATSSLEEKQVQAITDWVKRGGTLVLSGGAGYAKTAASFDEIAPIKATGTLELTDFSAVAIAGEAEWPTGSKMTVSIGELQNSSATLMQGDVPIAATRSVGLGEVVYAAFDPSLAPAATWSGSATLWSKLLQNNMQMLANGVNYYPGAMNQSFNRIIDEFPSINPPNFGVLLLIFGIYLFIVAPLLYFILAKSDRREWAWWLIPVLSIAAGFAVFLFGADDKRAMSAHTIEIVKLTGDGEGIVSGATAVFVPNGGTVRMNFGEKVYATSYANSYNNNISGNFNPNGNTQLVMNDSSTTAVWRDVSYWSTRKAWLDERVMEDEAGQFQISFKKSGTGYEVSVTNETMSSMTDVAVLMNGQAYRLGDLKAGESGSAAVGMGGTIYSHMDYGWMLFNHSGNYNDDKKYREREVLNSYMNQNNRGSVNGGAPVVVGFSQTKEAKYKVNGTAIKGDNLTMWVQQIDEMLIDGNKVAVSSSSLMPSIIENTLQHMNFEWGGMMYVGQGELVLQYILPRNNEIHYTELSVLNSGQGQVWKIWHEASGAWIDLASASSFLDEYLLDGAALRLKLVASSESNAAVPVLLLEGEVR